MVWFHDFGKSHTGLLLEWIFSTSHFSILIAFSLPLGLEVSLQRISELKFWETDREEMRVKWFGCGRVWRGFSEASWLAVFIDWQQLLILEEPRLRGEVTGDRKLSWNLEGVILKVGPSFCHLPERVHNPHCISFFCLAGRVEGLESGLNWCLFLLFPHSHSPVPRPVMSSMWPHVTTERLKCGQPKLT